MVRHRFDTDPDPTFHFNTDSDPILPQVFQFYSKECQSTLFYFSRQRQRCDNFPCFEKLFQVFLNKVYLVEMDTDPDTRHALDANMGPEKTLPIQTDPENTQKTSIL